jgi:hypothetical protein
MTLFIYEPNKYAPIVARDNRGNQPGEVVGMICSKHRVAFVVSPHREDQRHHGSTSPRREMSEYWRSMFDAVSIK